PGSGNWRRSPISRPGWSIAHKKGRRLAPPFRSDYGFLAAPAHRGADVEVPALRTDGLAEAAAVRLLVGEVVDAAIERHRVVHVPTRLNVVPLAGGVHPVLFFNVVRLGGERLRIDPVGLVIVREAVVHEEVPEHPGR